MLHAAGLEATEIARALDVHVNTVYSDLWAFDERGVASVRQCLRGGAPVRISTEQKAEILRLAETLPVEIGLPFGRWSLAKLREHLIKRRVVKGISREHLRRVLRKGGCAFGVSSASSSATTRVVARSWRGSVTSGATCPGNGVLLFFDVQPIAVKAYGGRRLTSAKRLVLERAQKTRGFFYLFVAYEVNTGRRRWAFFDGKSSEQVCRFMKQVHQWYPNQQVWVVLDRDSPHPCKSKQTRGEMRRLKLHWVTLPTGSPDDNAVGTIFSDI